MRLHRRCNDDAFFYIAPTVGISFTLTAFVAVVLGGLGNLKGALFGGFIIGVDRLEILMPEAALNKWPPYDLYTNSSVQAKRAVRHKIDIK